MPIMNAYADGSMSLTDFQVSQCLADSGSEFAAQAASHSTKPHLQDKVCSTVFNNSGAYPELDYDLLSTPASANFRLSINHHLG